MQYYSEILAIVVALILLALIIKLKRASRRYCSWIVSEIFFNHSIKTKGEITMVKTKVDQVFIATWPGPKDKYGNDATVQEGSVKFSSDDETVASIEANPDGGPYSAKIKTLTKTGATAVRISADADLGDGEKTIEGMLSVEVTAGDAVGFTEPETTEPTDNQETEE